MQRLASALVAAAFLSLLYCYHEALYDEEYQARFLISQGAWLREVLQFVAWVQTRSPGGRALGALAMAGATGATTTAAAVLTGGTLRGPTYSEAHLIGAAAVLAHALDARHIIWLLDTLRPMSVAEGRRFLLRFHIRHAWAEYLLGHQPPIPDLRPLLSRVVTRLLAQVGLACSYHLYRCLACSAPRHDDALQEAALLIG